MNIFAPSLDKAAREDAKMVVTLHYGTWIIYYLIIASISFIGILAGSGPVNLFVESIPQNLMNGLKRSWRTLPAVGFAMLMKLLWDNKLAVFYILGFVLTAYLQLPAVAVAVIGTVICVVVQRDVEFRDILKRKPAASSAVEGSAKEIERRTFSHEVKENLSKEEKKMMRSVFWRSWTMNASRTGATQYHAVGVMYTLLPVINRFIKPRKNGPRHWCVTPLGSMQPCISITSSWGSLLRWKKQNSEEKTLMLALLQQLKPH